MRRTGLPSPSRAEENRLKTYLKHEDRLKKASPDRAAVAREFGEKVITDHPDGSWTASIKHDVEKMKRAERMMRGVRKEQKERGDEVKASIEKERVKAKDGRVLDLYAHLAEQQSKKSGFRPMTTRHGPRDYFSFGDLPNHVKGPDGLWFVWDGGWVATNLWRNGAKSPQRDPDHNIWVETKDGWEVKEGPDAADDGDGHRLAGEVSRSGPGGGSGS